MNLDEFLKFKKDLVITSLIFAYNGDRTLLYGYNQNGNILHVYYKDCIIWVVWYRKSNWDCTKYVLVSYTNETENDYCENSYTCEYVIPEFLDPNFASVLRSQFNFKFNFAPWEGRTVEKEQYLGLLYEDLLVTDIDNTSTKTICIPGSYTTFPLLN